MHSSQAFTVLMMSRFFEDYLKDYAPAERQVDKKNAAGGWGGFFSRPKLELRSFIAQMATGEGKSILMPYYTVSY